MPLPRSMLVYVTWGSIKIRHPHAKPEKNSLPRQGFLVSSCFLLPVLVPSCSESLFQLQPGKRHALEHGLAVSAETIICGWNLCAVIGKYGYKSPCNCWGDVIQYFGSRQGDPGALVSLWVLRSFGLFRSFSFYTLPTLFFFFFRLTSGNSFHFLMDSLTVLSWLKSLCKTLQKWHQKNHHFEAAFFPCPLMSLVFELFSFDWEAKLAVPLLTQSQVRKEEWKPERRPRMSNQKTIKFPCQNEGKTKDVGLAWKIL